MTFKIIISLILFISVTTQAMEDAEKLDPGIKSLINDVAKSDATISEVIKQISAMKKIIYKSDSYLEALSNHALLCGQVLSIILYVDKQDNPIAIEKLVYLENNYLTTQLGIAEILCRKDQKQKAKNILEETIRTIESWDKKNNYARRKLEDDIKKHFETLNTDISSNPFAHSGRRFKNPRLSPTLVGEIESNSQASVPLTLQMPIQAQNIPTNKHSITFLLN